jgi:hypothetical protein
VATLATDTGPLTAQALQPDPSAEPVWSLRDRRIALLLLVGTGAVYLAITRETIYAIDGQAVFWVTKNLVNHASLHSTGLNDPFHGDTPYAPFGIGLSLVAIPFYVASKLFGQQNLFISLVNPIFIACSVVMVYRIARALRWSPMHGVIAAIGFGLCTQAVQATTEFFSESAVTLSLLVLVFAVIRWGQDARYAPLWIGLAAAAAALFREDSMFNVWVGLLAIPLFVPWAKIWNRRSLAMVLIPMAASLAWSLWYNELRYGSLTATEKTVTPSGFSTPLGFGLHGLLFDPGKGLFVFDSLAILGVIGLVALLFRNRPVAALFLLLIVPRLFFFAKFDLWAGGWAWGPRYLFPVVPLLVLAAVELLRAFHRGTVAGIAVRVSAVVLVMVSVAINYLSIRVPYEQWLQILAWGPASTQTKVGLHQMSFPQQLNAYDSQWSTSPIWGDVTLLRHGVAEMAPFWWLHGQWYIGLVFLAVAAVCLILAVSLARDSEGVPPHRGAHLAVGAD